MIQEEELLLDSLQKSGNSYSFGEEKLGVGRENAKQFLRENKDIFKKIEKEVLKAAKTIRDSQ